MSKKLLMLLCLGFFIVSCNTTSTQNKVEQQSQAEQSQIVQVEIADLISNTKQYADNKIQVTAIVNHVCSHGGKKMFLIDKASDKTIKIIPGKNIAAFNTDLVGHKVNVIGTIDQLIIDEAYLKEWEAELIAEANHSDENIKGENKHVETGSKADQADQGTHIEGMQNIADLRQEIAESDEDFIVIYTVVCEKLKTKEISQKE